MALSLRKPLPGRVLQRTTFSRPLAAPCRYKITVKSPTDGSEKTFDCDDETYILDAADEAGIDLPYSCRSGSCCSCAGKIESGTVDQSEQQFLDEDQVKDGFALLCVSYPKSDCVILTEQEGSL